MATLFVPGLWADAIMEKIMGGKAVIPGAMPLGGTPKMKMFPDLSAQLEAFFVAFALEDGTHPCPTYGIDRDRLTKRIQNSLVMFGPTPEIMRHLMEQYRATYNTVGDRPPDAGFLFEQLATCYVSWLYEQPESKALAKEEQERLASEKHETLSPYGYTVVDYSKDGWGYDG